LIGGQYSCAHGVLSGCWEAHSTRSPGPPPRSAGGEQWLDRLTRSGHNHRTCFPSMEPTMTSTNTPAVESTRMVKRLRGKRFLLLSLLLFLLAGGILLYMIMRPISMIEAYEKIQEGMTLEQLEDLIGKDKANVTFAEFAGESPHASA